MNPSQFAADLGRGVSDLQRYAEATMTLTLAAYSPGAPVTGPGGLKVPGFNPEGATFGKVQGGSQSGTNPTPRTIRIGDVDRPVLEGGLHIPLGAKVPVASEQRGVGWEYEVTAVGPLDDPALLGRRYLVVGVPVKSRATARRLDVIEL